MFYFSLDFKDPQWGFSGLWSCTQTGSAGEVLNRRWLWATLTYTNLSRGKVTSSMFLSVIFCHRFLTKPLSLPDLSVSVWNREWPWVTQEACTDSVYAPDCEQLLQIKTSSTTDPWPQWQECQKILQGSAHSIKSMSVHLWMCCFVCVFQWLLVCVCLCVCMSRHLSLDWKDCPILSEALIWWLTIAARTLNWRSGSDMPPRWETAETRKVFFTAAACSVHQSIEKMIFST